MTESTAAHAVHWPPEVADSYYESGLWRGKNLFHVLAAAAESHPEKTALVDGNVRISYTELIDRAEAGARRLIEAGFSADDRVIIQLPNSWQFTVLTFALIRAGIVPVMTLPAHREMELTGVAEVAQARGIVVPASFREYDHRALALSVKDACPSIEKIIVSDAEEGELSLEQLLEPSDAPLSLLPHSAPESVAVFLLSGGTTGLPKLISRTHNDYELNARLCSEVAEVTSDSVYLVCLPASHNFALACPGLIGTLFAGGTVVSLPSPDPQQVFGTVADESVTITAAVPAVAQRWIEYAEKSHRQSDLASLRVLQVGGSRLPDEIAARIRPATGATLQQVFGMAEGLINMTRLDDPDEVITTTQGRPVSSLDEVRITDAFGEDLPADREGTILTRGPYTPRGYYRAPEANSRSFVDGWYSSGDIVVRRSDGNLVVHGRDKDIINRGGEKISAEEIESLVYRTPHVKLAAVVAMPDSVLGERLCLYATVEPGTTLSLEEIRLSLTEAGIAAYKLPDHLEIVEDIPMTKVGKINKKELRDDIRQRIGDQ